MLDVTFDENKLEFYPGMTRYFATVDVPKQGKITVMIDRFHDSRKPIVKDESEEDVHPVIASHVKSAFRELLASNYVQGDY